MSRFVLVFACVCWSMIAGCGSSAGAATLPATPATLKLVFAAAGPGDTVLLGSGDYGRFEGASKSGTVTIKEQNGAHARMWLWLQGARNLRLEGLSIDGGYVTGSRNIAVVGGAVTDHLRVDTEAGITDAGIVFDGVTFTAAGGIPPSAYDGRLAIRGYDNTAPVGVQVKNSRFHGGCSDGVMVLGNAYGVQIGPGNTFEDIVQDGCGDAHTDSIQLVGSRHTHIHGNLFRRMSVAIMAPDGGDHELIEDNVIVARDYSQAVQLGNHRGTQFQHNTVIDTNVNMDSKTAEFPSTDGVLRDNIMVGGTFGTTGGGGCLRCSITHNLFDSARSRLGANGMIGAPLFVGGPAPEAYEGWALAPESPGRLSASDGADRGVRVGAPEVTDATQHARRANVAPTVSFRWAPRRPRAGRRTTFRSTISADRPVSCTWRLTNRAGTRVHKTASGCRLRHRFRTKGRKYVRLTVTDAHGVRARVKRSLIVRARR